MATSSSSSTPLLPPGDSYLPIISSQEHAQLEGEGYTAQNEGTIYKDGRVYHKFLFEKNLGTAERVEGCCLGSFFCLLSLGTIVFCDRFFVEKNFEGPLSGGVTITALEYSREASEELMRQDCEQQGFTFGDQESMENYLNSEATTPKIKERSGHQYLLFFGDVSHFSYFLFIPSGDKIKAKLIVEWSREDGSPLDSGDLEQRAQGFCERYRR